MSRRSQLSSQDMTTRRKASRGHTPGRPATIYGICAVCAAASKPSLHTVHTEPARPRGRILWNERPRAWNERRSPARLGRPRGCLAKETRAHAAGPHDCGLREPVNRNPIGRWLMKLVGSLGLRVMGPMRRPGLGRMEVMVVDVPAPAHRAIAVRVWRRGRAVDVLECGKADVRGREGAAE